MRRPLRLLVAVLLLPVVLAGCGNAPGRAPRHSITVHGATSPAVAEAVRLLDAVHVPAGAVRRASAPSASLRQAPDRPGVRGAVTDRARFWTMAESAATLDAWLAAHRPTGLTSGSTGSVTHLNSEARGDTHEVDYVDYTPAPMPAELALAQLTVAVQSLDPGHAAIGVYVQTLARPVRPAGSRVPTEGVRVLADWQLATAGTPVHQSLTGSDAATVAAAFDTLPVSVIGPHSCPMQTGDPLMLRFVSGSRSWRVTISNCAPYAVNYPGGSVSLETSARFLALLRTRVGWLPGRGGAQKGTMTPLSSARG